MLMRNHDGWDYDSQQPPMKHFKTSDERKQEHVKNEAWFCWFFFFFFFKSVAPCTKGHGWPKADSDLGLPKSWLEPLSLVQKLNQNHVHSPSVKGSLQIKKKWVFFSHKERVPCAGMLQASLPLPIPLLPGLIFCSCCSGFNKTTILVEGK